MTRPKKSLQFEILILPQVYNNNVILNKLDTEVFTEDTVNPFVCSVNTAGPPVVNFI